MSKPAENCPPVPPATEPLVSHLRALFLPLLGGRGEQAVLASRSRTQLLHDLFREGGRHPLASAQSILGADTIDLLLRSGILGVSEGEVFARFQLQTIRGLFILADLPHHNRLADYVLPVGAASRFMARLAIRRPAGTALDMGCGTGIQALLAAAHARSVIATDVNPRALALTRLNAKLNGIENVETLEGSLLEPAAGRTFDLILFNAPYILSPLTRRPHSHAGERADAYLYETISSLPAHLNEGGFAQVISNWVHREGESWGAPLEAALEGRGLDAFVMCQASLPVPRYVEYWLNFEIDRRRRPARYALESWRWRSWLRRRGIERIAFGSLTLRRRSGPANWLRFEQAADSFGDSLSDQLLAVFHNQDRLERGLSPGDLISSRPRPVNIEARPRSGGEGDSMHLIAGQSFPLRVRRVTLDVLLRLDGRATLGDAVAAEERRLGLRAGEALPAVIEDMVFLARYGWVVLEA